MVLNMSHLSILIIGGTGCLSSELVNQSLVKGFDVTILNRGNRISQIPKSVKLIKANKNDIEYISDVIKDKHYDAIIDSLSYTIKDLNISINLYANHTKQFIFISSCAVYDRRISPTCEENSPKIDERWNYSVDKWECESYLREQSKLLNFNYTIIRPSMTYGDTRIPYGIMPAYGWHGSFIQRVLNGKPIIRWDKGIHQHNIMRVEDFSRAFVLLIGNKDAYNQEFNICSEVTYSFEQVLQAIELKLKKKIIRHDISSKKYAELYPEKSGEIIVGRSSDSICLRNKFNNLFPDFKEVVSLEDGISRTIDAYFDQDFMRGIDYDYDGNCDRIIKKTSKSKKYHPKFIDYLGKNCNADRKRYYCALHRDDLIYKFFCKIANFIHRIKG